MSSPTYGTGTTASEQLLTDVTSIAALGPKEKPKINYSPRPELVRPAGESAPVLPPPQESVASAGSASWPESPEERRKRYRDEATENQDNPQWKPKVRNDTLFGSKKTDELADAYELNNATPEQQRAEFKRRQQLAQEQKQGTPGTRRYLSEPPVAYRTPASTAAIGELGEDEKDKEKARQRASKSGGGKKWWKPWE
ncbi:MAG: hypothetical protein ACRECW_10115 [Phyllobacterium sp.]